MSKINEVIEIVKGLTVLELNELVKTFEEEFGVSAAAPVAVAAAPAAGAAPAAAAAKPVKEKVSKEEADAIKTKLEEAGAKVQVK